MADLHFILRTFEQLTSRQIYEMGRLRQAVFVVEQDCPYLDFDGRDYPAHHLFAFANADSDEILGYCRILPLGLNYPNSACIGRVVTPTEQRGKNYGRLLMREAIAQCQQLYPQTEIRISAQTRLVRFYEELGFVATNITYLEDNIPHTEMFYR
jgi:ElaA protein